MNPRPPALSLTTLLDEAEVVLARAMPPTIARAIIELARQGASLSEGGSQVSASPRGVPGAQPDELLTTREAAGRLRVSEKQIYRLVTQGRLKRYGIGRSHKFRAAEVAELLARTTDASRAARAARTTHEQRSAS